MQADVIVAGAGLAGLSCARALAAEGLRVVVVESSTVAGGRARSWKDPGTGETVDIGPHVALNKYANFLALLDAVGTRDQIYWHTEKLLTVVDQGRRLPIRIAPLPAPLHWLRGLPQVLRSATLLQLLSNLRVAWEAARSNESDLLALDAMSARDYLNRRGVSRDFADWLWASASMALLNVPLEQCSAASLVRLAGQMMGQRDVAFGFPTAGLSDLYVPGCIEAIEAAGGEVLYDSAAAELLREQGDVDGLRLRDGRVLRAKDCVLALPPAELATLLPDHPVGRDAGRFKGSPYVSCYLWFDRKLGEEPFWALPWSPRRYNTDFYDLSVIRGRNGGSLVATNIIWSHRAAGMDDKEIIAATIAEIAEFAPAVKQARLLAHAVHRIPMSIPCPEPGTEALRPGTRDVQGVYLAGDWTRTGLPSCMESAARSGALAAQALLADRGMPRQLALPVPQPQGLVRWLRRPDRGLAPV